MDKSDDWITQYKLNLTDTDIERLLEELKLYGPIIAEYCPMLYSISFYIVGKMYVEKI